MDFTNRTFIVTGAGSGIGAATCKSLAAKGANIALWDISQKAISKQLDLAYTDPKKAKGYIVDITNYQETQECGKEVIRDFGGIYGLINCAGGGKDITKSIQQHNELSWSQQIDLNLNSMFNCSKAVIDYMMAKSEGKIVNLSSVAGMRGGGLLGRCGYATAKAGVIGLTKAMAKELADWNINVNCVAPALHITPLIDKNVDDAGVRRIMDSFPLRRAGDPSKLAELIAFLCSDNAEFITGAVYTADGGFSMH